MGIIRKIHQITHNRFLNYYDLEVTHKSGTESHYYLASRAETEKELKIRTKENTPDGVVIYCLYGEQKDKVVLIRQYRYPLDDFIYELPAGLVENGEDFHEAAVREMHEETGLHMTAIHADPMLEEPRFTTIGMTDESCATVYGYADGDITNKFEEESEEIQVVIADKEEVRRILREEKVAIICAYQMMHFLHDEEPFGFLKNT